MSLNIRPATPADVPQILAFIRELALYEREPDSVVATEADLLRDGFGAAPRFRCVLAAQGAIDEGGPRLEWDVLAWNQPAIDFYHSQGAVMLDEWRIMRVADEAL